MKKIINILKAITLSGVLLLASCNKFLDTPPDSRTEVDTPSKVAKLLVSAYAVATPVVLHELMSDNVTDKGPLYDPYQDLYAESYWYEDVTSTAQDSPNMVWQYNYNAIAHANLALESIEKMWDQADLTAEKGEALLCRAYAHFTLCNTFCQAYNPQTSGADLGIPYVYEVETTVFYEYERGTVADVYAKINEDIEEGLPLIDDNLYSQPKYHFNKKAAYAFAAQFNLYYGNYEKAIKYANIALGGRENATTDADPTGLIRDINAFEGMTSTTEFTNLWVSSKSSSNLLLQGLSSLGGRIYFGRYMTNNDLNKETLSSPGPAWVNDTSRRDEVWFFPQWIFVYAQGYFIPKAMEFFVYTDIVQGIGYPQLMTTPFTVEKTILDRAEAYAMLRNFDNAARDLSYFYVAFGGTTATATRLNNYYSTADNTIRKPINPRFTVTAGLQENMIHAVLHARRILTMHEGTRMLDIKRFGIEVVHQVVAPATTIRIEPYDKRLAIQIPAMVVSAGLEPNPR